MQPGIIHNPQLEGGPFLWEGTNGIGVLLSHGFTATTAEVRLLGKILHDRGYTVVGPLLPGHGTTPEEMNRCRRVFIGGESMGAVLALYLASEHPEAVGVLTYAPGLMTNLTTFDRIKLRVAAPFLKSIPKGSLDVADKWQGYPDNPLKAALQLMRLQKEVRARLPRVTQPVLTVQGRLDLAVDQRGAEIIQREIRSTLKELHWMERSTHVVILDQELDQVAEITLRFMDKALSESKERTQ